MSISWFGRIAERFRTDRRGSVVLMFALAAVPICVALGMALDYARSVSVKRGLDIAADAAVLAALTPLKDGRLEPIPAAEARALAYFDANVTAGEIRAVERSVRVKEEGGARIAEFAYSANVPAMFAAMVGKQVVPISRAVRSTRPLVSYGDIYLMLDVSGSMGLAADAQGQASLRNATGGCAFGCHISENSGESNYAIARRQGIRMRIDVLADAAKILIGQMRAAATASSPQGSVAFRLGLYTFESTAKRLLSVTADYDAASDATSAIALGDATLPGPGFGIVNADIGSQGDGRGANAPRKTVVLVTDGVMGSRDRSPLQRPFPVEPCLDLKRRGFEIAVVDVTYVPNDGDGTYDELIRPIYGQISESLRQCASPGLYFQGSEPDQIRLAFERMFRATQDRLRLTH